MEALELNRASACQTPVSLELSSGNIFKLMPLGLRVEGRPTLQQWLEAGKLFVKLRDSVHWLIGDWLNYGTDQYGLTYEQAAGLLNKAGLDYSYQTLRIDKYVASKVNLLWRHNKLTWQHHKEVASLEPEQQRYWLSLAQETALSTKGLRAAIKGAADLTWLRYSDVWDFSECSKAFGLEQPDRIPGQIVQNLLYYYSKPGSFVIDPTGTDGTALDVCTKCGDIKRECLSFGIKPMREGILEADPTKPWPTQRRADLIFVNIDYNNIVNTGQDFKSALRRILGHAAYHLTDKGIVSVLVAPWVADEPGEDWSYRVFHWLKYDIGLEYLRRIVVPMPVRQKVSPPTSDASKSDCLIARARDLLIFRKSGGRESQKIERDASLKSVALKCYYCGICVGPNHVESEVHRFDDRVICRHCLSALRKSRAA